MSDASDGMIIARVLSGDREQFAQIVRRYERPLLRVALSSLGQAEAAEDAVQEALIAAYRSLHQYDSKYSFRTWLWTIQLNECRRSWRRDKSEKQRTVNDAMNIRSEVPGPQESALLRERSQQIDEILQALSPGFADALRLRFFGGLKFHEIADVMGYSLSTAKNHVRRGLLEMSDLLSAVDPDIGSSSPIDSASLKNGKEP